MPKGTNIAESKTIRVTVSEQSAELLEQLAAKGIFGRNAAEVAARFIDKALETYLEPFKLRSRRRQR